MYIPTNKIQTNLFTSGNEFLTINDRNNYRGFYWVSHDGKFFTGKTPNDHPVIRLVRVPTEVNQESLSSYYTPLNGRPLIADQVYLEQTLPVSRLYTYINQNNPKERKFIPINVYTLPTESDYKLGAFVRYFAVKNNEPKFVEIGEDTYSKLKSRDRQWYWELYTAFNMLWTLTGDPESVSRANQNIISITEVTIKRNGLNQFLKGKYLEFYREDSSSSESIDVPSPSIVSSYTPPPPTQPPSFSPPPSSGGGGGY